jgi:hypothetical protein
MKIAFSGRLARRCDETTPGYFANCERHGCDIIERGRIRDIDGREAPGKFRAFVANRRYHWRARHQRTETEHACRVFASALAAD